MSKLVKSILKTEIAKKQSAFFYIGQEGFIFKNKKGYIAVDPYLSDYVDKNCSKLVPWKRLYPAPVKASELDFLDAVLCTHTHYDHADPWTLVPIANANPNTVFVIPAPEVETVASYGIAKERIIPAYAGCEIEIAGFKITPIPAAHEEFHTDEKGNYKEFSYIINDGSNTFFHSGDMSLYDGLADAVGSVDVALLCINGRDEYRTSLDIIGNIDCREAVLFAKELRAKLVVPMHHDLYAVNCESPERFVNLMNTLSPRQSFHLFRPGEKFIFSK